MSAAERVEAAVTLANAVVIARDDRAAGREWADIIVAMASELDALFAGGRGRGALTLLACFDLAITRASMLSGRSRQEEARTVLESLTQLHPSPG